MNLSPKISVVMSVYNGEKFLDKSIRSILDQTFSDFEFIIIDDCSTDGTSEILEKFKSKDKRIRLFRSEKNIAAAGFIKNLNLGIELSQGKFIARMDADDISLPDRFEKQVNFLEQNPDVKIVGAYIQKINDKGEPFGIIAAPTEDSQIKKKMPKKISLYHPVIMFRNNGRKYREKMMYCEDYDLYLNAITDSDRLANLDKILLQYRISDNSMSRRSSSFTRNLLVENCRQFYLQRKNTGSDNYEKFDPTDLIELLKSERKSSRKDLELGLTTALKFNHSDEFYLLIKKSKIAGIPTLKFSLIKLLPVKVRRVLYKFI